MAVASMTGFARVDGEGWALELRSVNGRGLDIKYRFPPGYEAVERFGRELAKGRFQRGQMNLTLSLAAGAGTAAVSINRDVLNIYVAAAQELIESGVALTPSADGLLALRGVVETTGETREGLDADGEAALAADLALLFERMTEARLAEGQALETILRGHLASIADGVERARAIADQQTEAIRERFTRRIGELLPDAVDFHERVLQEAAVLATKADVREELDRLTSHVAQAYALLGETSPGRKLDFLAQEFMREANTLCSKAAFIELTQVGLELKAVIDQLREQVQNVE